jgi:hypothetical protein
LDEGCVIVGGSDHPEDYQHEHDDQHRAETAAWEIAPVDTMWPNQQDTDQQMMRRSARMMRNS